MAPTPPPRSVTASKQLNVLITGFGSFMSVTNNPSWLAVKPLHDTYLDLFSSAPFLTASCSSEQGSARIQCLQLPVHYGSILDVVPRIHGRTPGGEEEGRFWRDPGLDAEFGGKQDHSYPDGYPVDHPESGWDVVLHVGVGRSGPLRVETLAHKIGYTKPDATGTLAPLIHALSTPTELVRGFGTPYSEFKDPQHTGINTEHCVAWLRSQGMAQTEVEKSTDPGRYLCDFVFYASLAESRRRQKGAEVLFVHVSPEGDRLEVERCTDAIRAVAWYMAKEKSKTQLQQGE